MTTSDPASAPDGAYPDPRLAPWPGFAMAADAAVKMLHDRLGLDLWLVTAVQGDDQVVVSSAGHWSELAPPGTVLRWSESFCLRMIDREGPTAAPDVRGVPAYARAATGVLARVRAYVGIPLEGQEGELFGTLCAFAGDPQREDLAADLDLVELVGRMLSTIIAREQFGRARSEEAAAALALADRDLLTGLRNRRGWESALWQEHQRCQRYGSTPSVVVVDLDDLKSANDEGGHPAGDTLLVQCASVLAAVSRPGDVLARVGGDEFGVLAVQCDAAASRALVTRLRVQLRDAGVAASVGSATRRSGEDLSDAWRRADAAMYREKRRRKQVVDDAVYPGSDPSQRSVASSRDPRPQRPDR